LISGLILIRITPLKLSTGYEAQVWDGGAGGFSGPFRVFFHFGMSALAAINNCWLT